MSKHQADLEQTSEYLLELLSKRVDDRSMMWLNQQKVQPASTADPVGLCLAFRSAARFFSKTGLEICLQEQRAADRLRQGFRPECWNVLQTARTYLLLNYRHDSPEVWLSVLNKLFETADIYEQESLYSALCLLPYPDRLKARAAEGLRTNVTTVFDSIALNNPYPAEYLDESAWNQMVLKAVFLQRPLYKLIGSDDRTNPLLAKMLLEYAHERWAEGRHVTPEIWRFTTPFLSDDYLRDFEKALEGGSPTERDAVLLACRSIPSH